VNISEKANNASDFEEIKALNGWVCDRMGVGDASPYSTEVLLL